MADSELLFLLGRGAFYGLLALVGTILILRKAPTFHQSRYWWLLGAAACNALLMPIGYMWITSYTMTYIDALSLRALYAGSWLVVDGYFLLAGVLAGGLVGFLAFHRQRPRS